MDDPALLRSINNTRLGLIATMNKYIILLAISILCYSSLDAFEYSRQPAGLINGVRLKYNSNDSIKVDVGYGEIMGDYWEITQSDTIVTEGYVLATLTPSTNGYVTYIYINRESSRLPSIELVDSPLPPTWSEDFMGWYRGGDRCIGAVWILPNGAVKSFYCPDDQTYMWGSAVILVNSTAVSTAWNVWNVFDLTNFSPANTAGLRLSTAAWENANPFTWKFVRVGCRTTSSVEQYGDGVFQAMTVGWAYFARNAVRQCSYLTWASSGNGVTQLSLHGYRIER